MPPSLGKALSSILGDYLTIIKSDFVVASDDTKWISWKSHSGSRNMGIGPGAAGCWIAHHNAWTLGMNSEFETVLFLEDDAKLTKYGIRHFRFVIDKFQNSDLNMLHLGDHEPTILRQPLTLLKKADLRIVFKQIVERIILLFFKPRWGKNRFPFSAHAYLVKRTFLPIIAKDAPMFLFPVDVYLNSISQVKRNAVACVKTPLFLQGASRPSLIDEFGR